MVEGSGMMLAVEKMTTNHKEPKMTDQDTTTTHKPEDLAIDDGVTLCYWSDRNAATVINRTPKTVTVQRDIAKRVDNNGMGGDQEYEYTRDLTGGITVFSFRKNGTWRARGGSDRGTYLVFGRREYYDYTF